MSSCQFLHVTLQTTEQKDPKHRRRRYFTLLLKLASVKAEVIKGNLKFDRHATITGFFMTMLCPVRKFKSAFFRLNVFAIFKS